MKLQALPIVLVMCFVQIVSATSETQQQLQWTEASKEQAKETLLARARDDEKRIDSLKKGGTRIEGGHVILWFPPSLLGADADALLKRLDPGVEALWRRVGVHNWQTVPKGKIAYYLHDDAFIAHASGRAAVFISMVHVKDGRAPFIHEATHELLSNTHMARNSASGLPPVLGYPLWLFEGLADYLARLVADELGIIEEGPFGMQSLSASDGVCAERARTPDGDRMLPFVGTAARPEVLFTADRGKFAPTFYACSLSFTKHLAERAGLETLIDLFALPPDPFFTRLDAVTGQPLSVIVTEWRMLIGLG